MYLAAGVDPDGFVIPFPVAEGAWEKLPEAHSGLDIGIKGNISDALAVSINGKAGVIASSHHRTGLEESFLQMGRIGVIQPTNTADASVQRIHAAKASFFHWQSLQNCFPDSVHTSFIIAVLTPFVNKMKRG